MSPPGDLETMFTRLQNLSLTSSLPSTTSLPDPCMYEYLAASSDSQFIYFTRISQATGTGTGTTTTTPAPTPTTPTNRAIGNDDNNVNDDDDDDDDKDAYYVPFFTDNFHTLLHEIANYFELPHGVADIRSLSVKAEGTECDGTFTELELGLDGICGEAMWEEAKRRLGDMGFGNKAPESGMQMGEGVVLIVQL